MRLSSPGGEVPAGFCTGFEFVVQVLLFLFAATEVTGQLENTGASLVAVATLRMTTFGITIKIEALSITTIIKKLLLSGVIVPNVIMLIVTFAFCQAE